MGSERITLRLPPDDAAALRAAAAEDECSVSECVRARVASRRPRPRRSATEQERAELARILAHLGKVGSNVNQLAAAVNRGDGVDPDEVAAARAALERMRDEIVAALPDRP